MAKDTELIDITQFIIDYLKIARRMWMWFLILCLAGSSVFYVKAKVQYRPMYTASATFTINIYEDQGMGSETTAFFDNEAAEQMATTFPYILTSSILQRRVAEDMGTAGVVGQISADVLPNTNLFTISVRDTDAKRAYATLRSVVNNYPEISEVVIGKTSMEMLDETGIPENPDNPQSFIKSAVKGAIFGVLAAAAWVLLLLFTRKTIRREEEIVRRVNTACLGTIPQIKMKRRTRKTTGAKILITDPKIEEQIHENLRMIRNKVEYHMNQYEQKVFMITSAIAGEGKSTVSVNLALSFAKTGKKVALVDCDLRNPSDREILGLGEGVGLLEVLNKEMKLKEAVLKHTDMGMTDDIKFMFLPGGKAIQDGSVLLGSVTMEKIIGGLKDWADIVILDCAPAGILTDAAILAQYADAAIFVVRKDFARVDHILDGMEHVAESRTPIIGSILNGA